MFQSYKATKGFDVSDWCKNFEIVFLGEEGKSFILSFNRDIYLRTHVHLFTRLNRLVLSGGL